MRRTVFAGCVVAACFVALWWAAPATAQPHGPGYGPHPGGPRFSVGFYYGPWYGPYFYSPWFYSSFWWYPPYAYGYPYYYGAVGARLRVQVQPKSAEVYVDGYLAGIVDQYDGMFQDLVVEPGGREVTVYQEGYKSLVQKVYLTVGSSYKIKGTLEKLAAGEPNEPRPVPPPEAVAAVGHVQEDRAAESRFGQVAIRVQPGDAEVTIDGEPWKGTAGADRLVVNLRAGTHRVEIRKDGFDSFVTAVEIRRGEVTTLNVSLSKL